jgi:GDP/UDP-N,N'-diacetylbacillosamine 2-epimerase (hydrolysing)
MKRKICVVTGTRAEFGLLRWLMEAINDHPELDLQLVATGMHLSPEFGSTFHEIEEAGLKIDEKVEMLLSSDTGVAVSKSTGLGISGFADVFGRLKPEIVVVLGDRFEIFAAATAATFMSIPIAHLHGGEVTEGAFDEALRHSITKMSHLHFVAAEPYRQRVVQLGEAPDRVFKVGGLGVDAIKKVALMSRSELEDSLGLRFSKRNLLVTFHPVTLKGANASVQQLHELLTVLSELEDTVSIITLPNADTGGRELADIIKRVAEKHENMWVFNSLGQLRYLSCLAHVDAVVGNSSSGLLEAPSFNIGTIDIGERQKGRLKADSVIECEPSASSIRSAFEELYSESFQASLPNASNPYGSGQAVDAIIKVLLDYPLEHILQKTFFDLPLVTEIKGDSFQ